jgi:hypothetical protein
MGGFGSGRYSCSSAPTCERTLSIDLAWLRRRGILQLGNRTTLTCSWGEEKTGSIGVLIQADGLRLIYIFTAHDDAKIRVDELVPFVYTPTRFGGRRQWLMCIKCGRRCRKLYGRRHFRCRQCHELKYASHNESSAQRALKRSNRIAERLHDMWNGKTRDEWEFPPKPLRMRWATYQRLLDQYVDLQNRWAIDMMDRLGIRVDDEIAATGPGGAIDAPTD